ncbi:MAG TPA: (2Fe-2S) ferredoxin domain-containing protein [Synechococcales cyanobacterium M55_K2018_004]|nr:(2Fe-2S) ferredoxin domain-containing protein [Synechococcales cyanobacterium M55_K2018_004]
MSKSKPDSTEPFQLEGQFLGFEMEGHKLKFLWMACDDRQFCIKLTKAARASVGTTLHRGDRILVQGSQCVSRAGSAMLKAAQVRRVSCLEHARRESEVVRPGKTVTVKVCYKSGCQKQGGKKRHKQLEQVLRDRNLHQMVVFEETGCLGKCSLAPNMVMLPGKKRLSGMEPEAIANLIEALHCSHQGSCQAWDE